MLQLNPALPVVTPYGRALAHLVVDYGVEHDLLWVCFHNDGQILTYPGREVQCVPFYTPPEHQP